MKIVSGFSSYLRCLTGTQYKIQRKLLPVSSVLVRFFSSVSYYEILNVPKNASQDEIKKAFFEKSKKYHPDVSPGNPHYHKIFVQLNNAYSVLSNMSKRKEYDRSLKPQSTTYHYPSSHDNWYKYRESSFYYGSNSRSYTRESSHHRSDNTTVALGVLAYMFAGASLCFLVIGNRHREYKKQLDRNSMKASKLYQESRERSSKYGFKKQLEILAEKQGKTIKKP